MVTYKKNRAFTVAEVLVATAVMALIGLGLLKLIMNARRATAIAECRGALRLNAQLAVKQLEKDIASSRALKDESDPKKLNMTVEFSNDKTGVSMQSSKLDSDDNSANNNVLYFSKEENGTDQEESLYNNIKYKISNGKLMREIIGGKTTRIADNIKYIEATGSADLPDGYTYDGKVSFAVTAAAIPAGEKDEITYIEYSSTAIRQLQNKIKSNEQGSHWKQRIKDGDY